MSFKRTLTVVLYLLSYTLFAQSEQKEIRLLNEESALPIEGATFEYGLQNGLSDNNGLIQFSFQEGEVLILSHVNYGTWTLSGQELLQAINAKVIYRKEISVNLYPVTVIALKPQGSQPEGELKIDYQERLEHDAANILNQTPAFNSIRKGGNYGFDPVFRGFKYDQLNVVMNGAQSATAACPNRMDPPTSQMAPNMMDRIEILKGPHALRYGTGLGATINFIPSKLRFSSTPETIGRVSTGYESNGNIFRAEGQIGFTGEKYDVSIFSSWSQGDDYKAGNGETVQADFSRGSFGTNVGVKLNANQQLRLSATYNRARDADFPALPMDLREDDTWLFNARHDIQFRGRALQSWNTTIFGSFVNHLMDNLLKPLDPRMLNAETLATTYNYGGRTEGDWNFAQGKLYAGADLRIEGAEGTRVREFLMGPMAGKIFEDNAWQDGRISKTGLFSEYHINGNSFDYIMSGRLEFNTANLNDPSQEFVQVNPDTQITQVNPNLSLGILKEFGNKIQTGLWLARAQRSGSLTERFINYFPVGQDPYEMLGNPQLSPEVNYQSDLTFKLRSSENSSLTLDIYAAYLQDYISSVIDPELDPRLPMSPGVRRYVNIDEAFKTGFEISWTQKLFAGLQQNLGIAYTYGQDLERDEPLPEIAPLDFRYALSGSYLNNKLKPEFVFRWVAEQSRVSNEFGETVTPSFALLDLIIGYQISNQFSLNAGVNNLLDENYYEHLNRSVRGTAAPIFAPGRNLFLNLNFTF
ncbi:TonB-dependent receptor domain-containing protein [Algoriphagus sediminis]|uniref:TonB-dependent receptor n=1 Tax=Algoriphagus sediminis TaxID=3057113 RepID=A0ABT7YF53_9BACT|nr:TonB-dependent receptor [Algoriphagus sediminis]MDN3205162.1 TonB-dependent receptor [Algoriphagus sediminis]